jgi:hypothetical protein
MSVKPSLHLVFEIEEAPRAEVHFANGRDLARLEDWLAASHSRDMLAPLFDWSAVFDPPAPVVDETAAAWAARVASTIVPNGAWAGMTIAAVYATGSEGSAWFSYVLRHRSKYDAAIVAAVESVVALTAKTPDGAA